MPKVGNKIYEYTPKGIANAKMESIATGLPIQSEDEMMYAEGGKVDASKRNTVEYLGGGMVKPLYKDGGKISSKDKKKLKKHSVHHSQEHMNEMKKDIKKGDSFKKAHNKAMDKVGK